MAAFAGVLVAIAVGAPGDLDSSFGTNGIALVLPPSAGSADFSTITRLADGSFIAVGEALPTGSTSGSGEEAMIAKLTPSGAVDPAFHGGSPVLSSFGDGAFTEADGIVIDGSGRLVVSGVTRVVSGGEDAFVARYTTNGNLDTTFDASGTTPGVTLLTPPGINPEHAPAVALDSLGRILVAGQGPPDTSGSERRPFVARLGANGAQDLTFGNVDSAYFGRLLITADLTKDVDLRAMVVDGSDRPVVAGCIGDNGTPICSQLLLARLTTAGNLDTDFGQGARGFTEISVPGADFAEAHGLALVGGKPVVSGFAQAAGTGISDLLLARFTADGSAFDPTFAGGGAETESIGSSSAFGRTLSVGPDGKLYVGGSAGDGPINVLAARFGANGGLDPTFGTGGIKELGASGSTAAGSLVEPDGAFVLAGQQGSSALVARLGGDPATTTGTGTAGTTTTGTTTTGTTTATTPAPPPPPVQTSFTGPATVNINVPAIFTANTQGADIRRYQWDFDGSKTFATDGGTSPTITHAFATAGSVTVSLRTTDANGNQVVSSQVVQVTRPPLANLRWTPLHPKPGQNVTFTIDSVSDAKVKPQYYRFSFGGIAPTKTSLTVQRSTSTAPAVFGHSTRAAGTSLSSSIPSASSLTLTSTTANLSATNTFTQKLPASGSIKVTAGFTAADGTPVLTTAYVGVQTTGKTSSGGTISAVDCAQEDDLTCPQITETGELASGFPVHFNAETPETQSKCLPKLANPQTDYQQAQNLGYPTDFGAPDLDVGGVVIGAIGARSVRAAGAASDVHKAHAAQCLRPLTTSKYEVVHWNYGDGTQTPSHAFQPSDSAPVLVTHTFANAGTYNVTLTVKVTVHQVIGNSTAVTYINQSEPVTVIKPFCGTLTLNTIKATTGNGCWIPVAASASGHPQYRPFEGDSANLDGVYFYPAIYHTITIDPQGARIWSDDIVYGDFHFANLPPGVENGYGPLSKTDMLMGGDINVPPPVYNSDAGGVASDLPMNAFAQIIGGLKTISTHLYLFPNKPVKGVLTMQLPPVFTGTGRVVLAPAGPTTPPPTFSMKFPQPTDVGPFLVKNATLTEPNVGGTGWHGGGSMNLLDLFTVDAPYIPASGPTSVKCGKGGPSGYAFNEDGSFRSGGATLKVGTDVPIGPIGLDCLQVSGQTDPFILQGKAHLGFPLDAHILDLDACFLVAHLSKNQTGTGCGTKPYKAPGSELWFHAGGELSLFDTLDLASAYFDMHAGPNDIAMDAGGGLDWSIPVLVALHLHVAGTIEVAPKPAFEFKGDGSVDLPNTCPFCISISVGVIVSSKGIAACATLFGFSYNWKDGPSVFAGCDLDDSSVALRDALPDYDGLGRAGPTAMAAAALGATATSSVKVPKGSKGISIEATGATGAPRLTVTDPTGHRYVDDGKIEQHEGGLAVLHLDALKKTLLTVRGAVPAGTWKVTSAAGSAAITGIKTRNVMPEADVTAKVTGRDPHRRLVYHFHAATGRSVKFVEVGASVTRTLGQVSRTSGTLTFPAGYGDPGKRKIYAYVEQDGIPRQQYLVSTYTASSAPKVGKATKLRLSVSKAVGTLRWSSVKGAASYTVTVKVGDGRVIRQTVKKAALKITSYSKPLGLRASVVAVSKYKRAGAAASLRVKPVATKITVKV